MTVVVIAVLVAAVSGVDDTAVAVSAAQESPKQAEARVRKIAKRAADLPRYAVVRVTRTDGTTVVLLVQEVQSDALVGTHAEGGDHRAETIPYAAIERIDEVKGRALKKVMKGAAWAVAIVGAAVGVLLIACAASAPDRQPAGREPQRAPPSASDTWR